MRPLTVSSKRSRRLRVIEKPLEDDCVQVCKNAGRLCLKSDATEGWPDRYLGLGYWIEFKATAFDRHAHLHGLLRPEQHVICRALHESNENVWVAILLIDTRENKRYVWFQHYGQFAELKKQKLLRQELLEQSISYETFIRHMFPTWVSDLKRHLYA